MSYYLHINVVALFLYLLLYLSMSYYYYYIHLLASLSPTSTCLREICHAPQHPYMQDVHNP
jgi:hypothetical protein